MHKLFLPGPMFLMCKIFHEIVALCCLQPSYFAGIIGLTMLIRDFLEIENIVNYLVWGERVRILCCVKIFSRQALWCAIKEDSC